MFYRSFFIRKGFRNFRFRSNSNEYDAAIHPIGTVTKIPKRNAQLMHNLRATAEGDEIMLSDGEAANGPDIQAS
jgi:hypothetical protein